MPVNPSSPHIDVPTPEIHGRMLTPKEMLAVGIIGTIAATGAANYLNGEEGRPEIPAFEVEWDSHHQTVEVPDDTITVKGKDGKEITVKDGRPDIGDAIVQSRETQEIEDSLGEEWARQFAEDVNAGKLINPSEVDAFAARIKNETDAGWQIDKISVLGTASAEDDTTNEAGVRTAGLQETSPSAAAKQSELGDRRRDIGTLQLASELQERGISIDPTMVEQLPSIEDVLSDEEVQVVDGLADRFGYDSTTRMIEDWNRHPEKSPPEVDQTLTEMLAKERTFQVKVSLSKAGEVQERTGSGDDGHDIDITPGSDEEPGGVVDVQGDSEHHKFRFIPILIPGYLFITMGRTRIRLPGGPAQTNPPAGAGPLPSGGGNAPQATPEATPKPRPPKPPVDGPPRPPRTSRESFPRPRDDMMPRSRVDRPAIRRKQPRNHNFSQNRGQLAGGSGRMSRNRGGNRSGKRSSR